MRPEVRHAVERIAGPVESWRRPDGGYSPAERWVVRLASGGSAFVKAGVTGQSARRLRVERRFYESVEADFLPRLLGADDSVPLMVLEDLSEGRWPPPWEDADVEAVLSVLREIPLVRPPSHLGRLEDVPGIRGGWESVAADPDPFLSTGLCSPDWLRETLPVLLEAERRADLAGEALVHFDIRSDNLCLLPGRAVVVDWDSAAVGNPEVEVAGFLPSLRLEGGPLPDELWTGDGGLPALLAGFWACRMGLEAVPDAPRVRWIQRRAGTQALWWTSRALGLPEPDGRWAQEAIDAASEDFRSGRINADQWTASVEEALVDAYLLTADPRLQSGKGGDEDEWRWSRELILDCFQGDATVLDVGCANGYLMQSLKRWGAERGRSIECWGLEISSRLAWLARRRVGEPLASRIFVDDARKWVAPRRFDVVHTGLDYAPPGLERDLVSHLLSDVVAPGGRLVLRAERVRTGTADLVEQLSSLGWEPDGVVEAVHPKTGEVRRTAWVRAAIER
ncbi:MAG TPA: phosphotransferase [Actinomycetota bacterium]|nr:phosphotransferase [Actinomycetota bacterium]